MSLKKKLLSIILACGMILSLTACSQSGAGTSTGDTPDSTTPEGTTFSGSEAATPEIDENAPTGTITWLMYEDLLSNASETVAEFESTYKANIEQIQTSSGSAYFEKLGALIASGDSPDIVRYEWMSFPHGMSYNMYTAIDSYIDFDSDLWKGVKDVAEQFVYNGKHFYAPHQLKTNFALNYNSLVLQEAGFPDPYEMLQNNEWTWTAFEKLLKDWCDLNPENVGYTGVGAMSFIATTGTKLIDVKDGQIINNVNTENVSRCMQWLESLNKEGLFGSGYVSPQEAFVDGKLLFLGMDPSWTYGAAKEALDKGGIDNEMMFVPFPRDDNSDTYYHAIDTFGYLIPANAPNVKGAVDWIVFNRLLETDVEGAEKARADAIDDSPAYYPKCSNNDCNDTSENADAKGRHIFTDEENETGVSVCPSCGTARKEKYKIVYTEEMYDLLKELASADGRFTMQFDNCFGFGDDVSNLFQGSEETLLDGPLFFENGSFTQLSASLYDKIESYIQPYRDRMAEDAASAE